MNLVLNGQELSLDDVTTLAELLANQQINAAGVAVAVNNRIIRRDEWATTELGEGDKVTVIQATYGG